MIESKTVIDTEKTGENLRRYAKSCGYSVKDIQEFLGLSCPQPVYRWFKGTILPSVDNLLRLSELFDVHMEDLLIKRSVPFTYDFYLDMTIDSVYFLKRMQAYCSFLSA